MAHPHVMAHVREKPADHLNLNGSPAVRIDGIGELPDNAQAIRPVQAYNQGILAARQGQRLIVSAGGLQFLVGEELGYVHQFAVR